MNTLSDPLHTFIVSSIGQSSWDWMLVADHKKKGERGGTESQGSSGQSIEKASTHSHTDTHALTHTHTVIHCRSRVCPSTDRGRLVRVDIERGLVPVWWWSTNTTEGSGGGGSRHRVEGMRERERERENNTGFKNRTISNSVRFQILYDFKFKSGMKSFRK